MALDVGQSVTRLIDAFVNDHPEYAGTINKKALRRRLETAHEEVLRGDHTAKSDEQLDRESEEAGIKRHEYLDLINMSVHAATDRPTSPKR